MNSQAEFLSMYLQHEENLRAFIGSLVRSRQDFDDILQETVLTLWQKFDEYEFERSFGAWARGIAANKILQFRQRSGRVPTPFSPEAIQAIVESFESHALPGSETAEALEKCLEQLPPRSRQVLAWWYAEAWPIERIAAELGRNTTAAYRHLSRLRARLHECIRRRLSAFPEARG